MATEIERRFLVAHDGWSRLYTDKLAILNGLIAQFCSEVVPFRINIHTIWLASDELSPVM